MHRAKVKLHIISVWTVPLSINKRRQHLIQLQFSFNKIMGFVREACDAAFKFVQNKGWLYLSCLYLRRTFSMYNIVTPFGNAKRPQWLIISTCIVRACFIKEIVPAQQQWRPNRAGRIQHIHQNMSNLFHHAAAFWRQHAKHSPDMLHPSIHTKAQVQPPPHAPHHTRACTRLDYISTVGHWCQRHEDHWDKY